MGKFAVVWYKIVSNEEEILRFLNELKEEDHDINYSDVYIFDLDDALGFEIPTAIKLHRRERS